MYSKLDDKQWKEFKLGDLFTIKIGKNIDGNKIDKIFGNFPYITRKESNNGNDGFIDYDDAYLFRDVPVITIGNETASPFVQTSPFFTGTKVNIMKYKGNIDKYGLYFISQCIRKQKNKFSYVYTMSSRRLQRQTILLSICEDRNPDTEYMSAYIKLIFAKKRKIYQDYAAKAYKKLSYKKIPPLEEKIWKDFFIEDIAEITSGRDIYEKERKEGKSPYVSSTAHNNGIGYFVGNDNETLREDCISVNRNGSVGYAFFHPYKALFSNDCRTLKIKNVSKYANYFIATQITKQRKKYNYGYKMGTARLRRQKILLPINARGEPDYPYMEQYMINLEWKKRKQYFDHHSQ